MTGRNARSMEINGSVRQASNSTESITKISKVLDNRNVDLEGKFKIAMGVDERIMEKYNRAKPFINTLDASDEVIAASLPKPDSAKFVEANGVELTALKEKTENLKKHRNSLQSLGL